MKTSLITAVDHRHEADLVATVEGNPRLEVMRRCADSAELVSVAAAGAADVALVSGGFRGVDREVIRSLAAHGVVVVGVLEAGDEAGERTLRQLGVRSILRVGMTASEVVDVIVAAVDPATAAASSEPAQSLSESSPGASAGALPDSLFDRLSGVSSSLSSPTLGTSPSGLTPGGSGPLAGDSVRIGTVGPGASPTQTTAEGSPRYAGGSELPLEKPGGGDLLASSPGATSSTSGEPESAPGTLVAVWGPIGSPGRTTIAVTLAAVLAAREVSVLLVDGDTHGSSIAQVLGLIDEAPGIAAAARLSDQGGLDLASLSRVSPEVSPRLRVLTGLPRADRWPELRSGAMSDLLSVARRLAAVVIVDCAHSLEEDEELSYDTAAPRRNAATLSALTTADIVLAVGAADPVGLQRLVRGLGELERIDAPDPLVLVNKVRPSTAGPHPERSIKEVLERFSGLGELEFLPWAPAECDAALWAGRSLAEVAPGAALTAAVGRLAERIRPSTPTRSGMARRQKRSLGRVPV